jgi:hypothetical protein
MNSSALVDEIRPSVLKKGHSEVNAQHVKNVPDRSFPTFTRDLNALAGLATAVRGSLRSHGVRERVLDSRTGWESMAATNLGIDIDREREDVESLSSRKQTFIWFFETGTADDPKRLEPEAATASDARWW